jgi:putative ABC transport system permease protein
MIQDILQDEFPRKQLIVKRWDEMADYYHAIRAIYYIIFGFMGSIIFIIVVLSCVNTSLMASMERISEIGTLRSIGISLRWISAMFLLEGAFIGIASVLLGIIFQLIVTVLVNRVEFMMPPPPGMDLPYQLQIFYFTKALPFVAFLIVMSTTLSSAFTMWRVKKITITEALNHV